MVNFFETPLRKKIQQLTSYANIFKLNGKKTNEVYGKDNDWLIGEADTSTTPDKPDSTDTSKPGVEDEQLWKTLDYIVKQGKDGTLTLSNIIPNKVRAREIIMMMLLAIQERWRSHLESTDKNILFKEPVLGLPWKNPEKRKKGKEILGWIIETRVGNMTYEQLAEKWNEEVKKDKDYDFDNALFNLNMLLEVNWEQGQATNIPNSTQGVLIQALETYLPKERVKEKLGDVYIGWPK